MGAGRRNLQDLIYNLNSRGKIFGSDQGDPTAPCHPGGGLTIKPDSVGGNPLFMTSATFGLCTNKEAL